MIIFMLSCHNSSLFLQENQHPIAEGIITVQSEENLKLIITLFME